MSETATRKASAPAARPVTANTVWVTPAIAGETIARSAKAFMQMVYRKEIPERLIRHIGKRCVLVDRQGLLDWIAGGAGKKEAGR
jgi:hypothetical protein